jgi:hypothetical protein
MKCNDWPRVCVSVNDCVFYDDAVAGRTEIQLQISGLEPQNQLLIRHYGKQFGDSGRFDTDLESGADRGIIIHDIRFDDITISTEKIQALMFHTQWTQHQLQTLDPGFVKQHDCFGCNGYLGFNGHVAIDFWTPIMQWLGVYKYKVSRQSDVAYFSGYDQRWHYEKDLEILQEIKELMNLD